MDFNTPSSWTAQVAYSGNITETAAEEKATIMLGGPKFSTVTLQRIALSVVPLTLTFCTILGNVFVIVAVFINTRISRRNTTVLVLNLAIADLFVGSVIMPISVLQIFTGGVWMLSRFTCKVWTSLDVISCTASIVTLCIISIERFIGVTRPLEYCYMVTKRRLIFAVLFVWLYSFTVLLATVRWDDDENYNFASGNLTTMAKEECNVGGELKYVMQSVMFSFFIPLFVILLVYTKIYKVIRRRESNLLRAVATGNIVERKIKLIKRRSNDGRNLASRKSSSTSGRLNLFTPLRMHYGGITTSTANGQNSAPSGGGGCGSGTGGGGAGGGGGGCGGGGGSGCGGGSGGQSDAEVQKQRNFFQKQLKTAKTLGIVVGAFVICWLPFFILYLIRNMCNNCYIPEAALEVFSWLGYGNSALNPVIYAVSMRTFANTFRHICHCCPCCFASRRSSCRMSATRCSMQRRKSTATMRSSIWSRSESSPDVRRIQLCRPSQSMCNGGSAATVVAANDTDCVNTVNNRPNCHANLCQTYSVKCTSPISLTSPGGKGQSRRFSSAKPRTSLIVESYQNGATTSIPVFSYADFKCRSPTRLTQQPSSPAGYNNYIGARLSTERMFRSNVIEL